MLPATLNDRRRCGGFTLVELLLAVALLVLLIGAIVFSFSNLQEGAVLEEGASQLEALFRFARAHACATGRQVQISFEEDLGGGLLVPLGHLQVLWEPDPVDRPGVFEPLQEASAYVEGLIDRITIEDVHPWPVRTPEVSHGSGGASLNLDATAEDSRAAAAGPDNSAAGGQATFGFAPVMFYPDGSGDSVELVVAGRDALERRLLALSYSSMTGTFRRRYLPREEDAGAQAVTEPDASPLP